MAPLIRTADCPDQVGSEAGAALKGLGVRALVQQLVSTSDAAIWRCDSLLVRGPRQAAGCHADRTAGHAPYDIPLHVVCSMGCATAIVGQF